MRTEKRMWLTYTSFEDLITRFNPFGFKEQDGTSMAFPNYGEVYLFTLRRLQSQFPRGFVDITLFIHQMSQMPMSDCKQVVKSFKTLGLNDGVMLIEYWNPETNPKYEFEKIMRAFHTLSETTFNKDYYNDAWNTFENDMKNAKTKVRVENGSIVKPFSV